MLVRLITIAFLVLIGACTRPISMDARWQPGARPASPFSKVLVVAISEDFDRRRLFEDLLASELGAGGATVIPSTRSMLTTDPVNRKSVAALVKSTGADAVLVTRLVDRDVAVREKPGREVLEIEAPNEDVPDMGQSAYDIYRYDYSVGWEPSSLVINQHVKLTTDLFGTGSGKLLYTIRSDLRITQSDSPDQDSLVAVIDELAADIARRLREDGAVR